MDSLGKLQRRVRGEGVLCNESKWLSELRNYGGCSRWGDSYRNEEYESVRGALCGVESKLRGLVLPFIESVNEIVRSYLSVVDLMEDGVNTPWYKMFGDFRRLIRYDCFLDLYKSPKFYKPVIVLVAEYKGGDLFELEMSHNFDKYRVVELVAGCYVSMGVYCGGEFEASVDSGFGGFVIDVTDPYKRVFVKFWSKSKQVVLVLECLLNRRCGP